MSPLGKCSVHLHHCLTSSPKKSRRFLEESSSEDLPLMEPEKTSKGAPGNSMEKGKPLQWELPLLADHTSTLFALAVSAEVAARRDFSNQRCKTLNNSMFIPSGERMWARQWSKKMDNGKKMRCLLTTSELCSNNLAHCHITCSADADLRIGLRFKDK